MSGASSGLNLAKRTRDRVMPLKRTDIDWAIELWLKGRDTKRIAGVLSEHRRSRGEPEADIHESEIYNIIDTIKPLRAGVVVPFTKAKAK